MKGRVLVISRSETLDPDGQSLAKTLEDGGLDGVVSVRQGKFFEIEMSTTDPAVARAQLTKMAREHLADPAKERVEVLVPGAGPEAYGLVAVYDRRQDERRSRERRDDANRRSGRDRRLDALAAKESADNAKELADNAEELADNAEELADNAEELDEKRRASSDRREDSDRRDECDRRDDSERRAGMERRFDEERRTDDEDLSGPERRGWFRRRADQ